MEGEALRSGIQMEDFNNLLGPTLSSGRHRSPASPANRKKTTRVLDQVGFGEGSQYRKGDHPSHQGKHRVRRDESGQYVCSVAQLF